MKRYLQRLSERLDEKGSIMALTLMVLVGLTIMGLSAIQTVSVESLIAGNTLAYKQNMYLAEAAAMEAMERIRAMDPAILRSQATRPVWINNDSDWTETNSALANDPISNGNGSQEETRYKARFSIDPSSSQDVTDKNRTPWVFTIEGRHRSPTGTVVVRVALRMFV